MIQNAMGQIHYSIKLSKTAKQQVSISHNTGFACHYYLYNVGPGCHPQVEERDADCTCWDATETCVSTARFHIHYMYVTL